MIKEQKPLVSVIIPTYNNDKYICEAVQSVLDQSFQEFEIIVIDDGSTDRTQDVLKQFTERIICLYQSNKGVAAARNLGIKKAQGDFIAFLDGDDLWLSEKLSIQMEVFKKFPQAGMLFTDGDSFDANGRVRESLMRNAWDDDNDPIKKHMNEMELNDGGVITDISFDDFIKGNRIFTSSAIIRKECIDDVGNFDETLKLAEDYDLWLRISAKYPSVYVNRITARYRIEQTSLSGDFDFRFFKYCEWNGKMFSKMLKGCELQKKNLLKKRALESFNKAAWGYREYKEYQKMTEMVMSSLKVNLLQLKMYLYFFFYLRQLFFQKSSCGGSKCQKSA